MGFNGCIKVKVTIIYISQEVSSTHVNPSHPVPGLPIVLGTRRSLFLRVKSYILINQLCFISGIVQMGRVEGKTTLGDS